MQERAEAPEWWRGATELGESAEDLDLDFSGTPRVRLISRLLSLHLERDRGGFSDAEVTAWSLPRRTQGLLAVALASLGGSAPIEARCPSSDCGEPLELEFDLGAFVERLDSDERLRCEPEPGVTLALRVPTGADQLTWIEAGDAVDGDLERLARSLLEEVRGARLGADELLPRGWLDSMEAALEEADPLTALRLDATCPACEGVVEVELDLEELLLRRLEARRDRVLDEVHALARAYHWTEGEILALPRWRRRYYLGRTRAEVPE